jgi:large subunit ribosomal protein L9
VKVILLQEIANLGKPGEVKEVKPGYARNYLLAKRMAVEATPGQLRNLAVQHEIKKRQVEVEKKTAQTMAEKLTGVTLVFRVRLGEQMRMYGSITSHDLAEALQNEHGITIDRHDIELDEPIKSLGTHTVQVKLGPGVRGTITVEVAQIEEAPAPVAAAPAEEPKAAAPVETTEEEPAEAPAGEPVQDEEPE